MYWINAECIKNISGSFENAKGKKSVIFLNNSVWGIDNKIIALLIS